MPEKTRFDHVSSVDGQDRAARYTALVENSPYCIHEIGADGLLVSMNPAGLRMMGVDQECQIVGTDYLSAVREDDRPRIQELLNRALAGTFVEFEFVAVNDRVFRSNFVPLPARTGSTARLMGITQDITDRRDLEKRLHRSRQMDAVGRLAGGVAHDFNNLLTVILGASERLAARGDDGSRAEANAILDACRRATELTSQLLSFSKKQITRPQRIDVREHVRDTIRLLERLLPENVTLSCTVGSVPLPTVIDPAQFDQVLLNLATNARDAMPGGGRLDIELGTLEVEGEAALDLEVGAGDYLRVDVSDEGEGIGQEHLDQIFEPFFTTKGSAGTGLGLATCHGIITQAGGAIRVNTGSQGTTFRVLLPLEEGEVEESNDPETELGSLEAHVLLVEDNDLVRESACASLEHAGCTVVATASAEEALQVFHANPGGFDLLFTDVVLTHMDGRGLAEKLIDEAPNLRVLYTSGYTEDEVVVKGVRDDRIHFLPKPYAFSQLVAAVKAALTPGADSGSHP